MYLNPNLQGDLVLATNPTTKVVSVTDVKSHLRIDTSDEDTLLGLYIDAATEMAENFCGRHFITHEYKLYFDSVTSIASLVYPDCVLDSVNPVNWIDANGDTQASLEAHIDAYSNPSIAYLNSGFVSSPLKSDASNVFWFEFGTGFGAASSDVPEAIKQAIKLIVADMYYFREDRKRTFPMTSEILLQPYKCYY
jgi:uncharacterized phiE125 gp8 family phage protein